MGVEFFTRGLCLIDKFWQDGELQCLRLDLKTLSMEKISFPRSPLLLQNKNNTEA